MEWRKKKSKGKGRGSREGAASFEYTFLVAVTLVLLAVGVVMVFSASWANAYFGENKDSYYYLKRELFFAALGLVFMFVMAKTDYSRLRKAAPVLMVVSLGMLLMVFIPGIGYCAKGACRWVGAGSATFQPSELAKLAVILYVSTIMYTRPRLLGGIKRFALPIMGLPVLACLFILAEPDMGTTITIVITLAGMLLVGGVRMRDMAALAAGAGVLGLAFVAMAPYRVARFTAFLDPYEDAHGSGFQIIQSLVALGSGGVFGVGIGKSIQKFNYLPEAHTDMILSIIGEEVGLLGVLAVIILYGAFAYVGFRIALRSRDLFGKYVAAGITSLLVGQAAVNLCAVTGIMPLTGIPLPIISYGGSSLVVMLASIGILLNIAVNQRSRIAAAPNRKFRAIEGGNSRRGDGRSSRTGPGSRRRVIG
ncbi:MAG: putative lipid II flippase FtsW [Thermoleophilia bacterium]